MAVLYDVKLEIFIPEGYSARLLDELSKVGVGRIGNYDHCASISNVRGYWRPLEGADPFDGEIGKISEAAEHKVEVNCNHEQVRSALKAIQRVHPYDQPVINVVALSNHLFESEN
jgi:hypothetical protein